MHSVLIANHGEIAIRIIRTAKRLGIRTIAVYSEADANSPHVSMADETVFIGASAPQESYLNIDKIVQVAIDTGADAVHPGYGFLSENAEFARRVEEAGIVFMGPTPEQISQFGTKHTSRELAIAASVPLMEGSKILESLDHGLQEAERIGYPVMLKATGGGGGIGMKACHNPQELQENYESVQRIVAANFSTTGVFLEKLIKPARHVEVQIFGDGNGGIAILGDRDCSLQRRNQKVIEEAPAPNLPQHIREELHNAARRLGESVHYRSAGTIEFIYDPVNIMSSFLEVNARLQVEHPVTEEVFGIDIVEQMFKLAFEGHEGVADFIHRDFTPQGCAMEARVYAEDPNHGGLPSAGLVTLAQFPEGDNIRVDRWIETGLEISTLYDPMIAKIIVHGNTREQALDLLQEALDKTLIRGVSTNIGLTRGLPSHPEFHAAKHSTSTLDGVLDITPRIDVIKGGLSTTIQDLPGRVGYWCVGIPPSGPMDSYSFALANQAVGNAPGVSGLEITLSGPVLEFNYDAVIALTGAQSNATLDDKPVPFWEPIYVKAGQTLDIGTVQEHGVRTYMALQGGFSVPKYMGSASTFPLGKIGGHSGRPIGAGDVLRREPYTTIDHEPYTIPPEVRPQIGNEWDLGMLEGPLAAPEYLKPESMETFFSSEYTVHFNSDRTGIRLVGPQPEWSREDGGEAGLHPSNVHDYTYVVGAVNFTGDTPVILGVDGPSLGGFVCPAVVAPQQLWKIGQLRPGNKVRFVPLTEAAVKTPGVITPTSTATELRQIGREPDQGVIDTTHTDDDNPQVQYRRFGANHVLLYYGKPQINFGYRMRIHAMQEQIKASGIPGIEELSPGMRSLLITYDPAIWGVSHNLVDKLKELEKNIGSTRNLVVPSRIIKLPISWDDEVVKASVERYQSTIRQEAPWLPSNIEFIRRANGLASVEEVFEKVTTAEYMVMGLGDVYLGAPVAVPIDPRKRLLTSKYNPARTFTPEGTVGIGGSYLCVYGMDSPGGYQLVGRTVPVYSRYVTTGFYSKNPWALQDFDRISWYPVSEEKLNELRRQVAAGRDIISIEESEFSYADYVKFVEENKEDIERYREKQNAAFDEEKQRWVESGEFDRSTIDDSKSSDQLALEPGNVSVQSPIMGGVWKIEVEVGQHVEEGQLLCVLEAMKMETPIHSPVTGHIVSLPYTSGDSVTSEAVLAVVHADEASDESSVGKLHFEESTSTQEKFRVAQSWLDSSISMDDIVENLRKQQKDKKRRKYRRPYEAE